MPSGPTACFKIKPSDSLPCAWCALCVVAMTCVTCPCGRRFWVLGGDVADLDSNCEALCLYFNNCHIIFEVTNLTQHAVDLADEGSQLPGMGLEASQLILDQA